MLLFSCFFNVEQLHLGLSYNFCALYEESKTSWEFSDQQKIKGVSTWGCDGPPTPVEITSVQMLKTTSVI